MKPTIALSRNTYSAGDLSQVTPFGEMNKSQTTNEGNRSDGVTVTWIATTTSIWTTWTTTPISPKLKSGSYGLCVNNFYIFFFFANSGDSSFPHSAFLHFLIISLSSILHLHKCSRDLQAGQLNQFDCTSFLHELICDR